MILLLQDRKGFRKEVYAPIAPPTYQIAVHNWDELLKPIDEGKIPSKVVGEYITFYPEDEPYDYHGVKIQLYKEMGPI